MDLSGQKDSRSIDPSVRESADSVSDSGIGGSKSCADCRTTKTPLWRGGPSGPKSLCNACGIRYRKKRRAVLGMKERRIGEGVEKREEGSIKMRVLGLGRDLFDFKKKMMKKRMLGEEEEAAVLLMALSSGLLYAA